MNVARPAGSCPFLRRGVLSLLTTVDQWFVAWNGWSICQGLSFPRSLRTTLQDSYLQFQQSAASFGSSLAPLPSCLR
jgi:hypothetical protein